MRASFFSNRTACQLCAKSAPRTRQRCLHPVARAVSEEGDEPGSVGGRSAAIPLLRDRGGDVPSRKTLNRPGCDSVRNDGPGTSPGRPDNGENATLAQAKSYAAGPDVASVRPAPHTEDSFRVS